MKILLIEDDRAIAEFIRKGLSQEGFVVEHSATGDDGLFRGLNKSYDMMIVDVMLPGLDGFTVVERLRKDSVSTPVLFLSARSSVEDRVTGLSKGGDDYLVKPFAFSELVARVKALLRRANAAVEPATLRVADLVVDLLERKAYRQSLELELQPLEYMLLVYMMNNAGKVISKITIMEHVWEYNFDPGTNVVEARICKLRDKVDRPFDVKLIHTVRGFGYVLQAK